MIELFTIKDVASKTTNQVMCFTTSRDAVDAIKQVVNDPKTTLHQHPQDFSLWSLGSYDPRTMEFKMLESPTKIIEAQELVNKDS